MSCPVESDLLRYEEEQDQLSREELEKEQNPIKYWRVATSEWEDYASTEEEKEQLIDCANTDKLSYTCVQLIEGGS
mgnify:CR=1 FL=1